MPAGPDTLELVAPLSGILVPLERVPDSVFAQKMAGDGISIDPTSSELLAPVAGIVTQLHAAHHALTLSTADGLEVLLHIGVGTVLLRGEGFTAKVKQGDVVRAGQPLIAFDADLVARQAKSLLTQVLIANGERVLRMVPGSGLVRAGKDVVLVVERARPPAAAVLAGEGPSTLSPPVVIPNPGGLHARPAAVLAQAAKRFRADLRLVRDAHEANARSLVAVMGLSVKEGELVRVKASGADAAEACAALAKLLAEGCGEAPGETPFTPPAPAAARAASSGARDLVGVPASPGLAVGHVVQVRPQVAEVVEAGEGAPRETARLKSALQEASRQLDALKGQLADASKTKILDAHQELLEDPELLELAARSVAANKSAAFAWREAVGLHARLLEGLDNPLLRERANDLRDVGRRVLALLAGLTQARPVAGPGSIIVAETLSPSDTASLDRSKVVGFCTTTGGPTGHVAILARSLGIPALCAIDAAALSLPDGTRVLLDGTKGTLRKEPTEAELADARQRMSSQAEVRVRELRLASAPALTTDGHRIEVVANIRNAEEARDAVAAGGDGVGLLRSEFLFGKRDAAPSENEQAAAYKAVAAVLGRERTLVIRTLDVGGDKPLSYLPLPKEDNPFLGLRGVRVSLHRPELFRTQLRAILQAAPLSNLHVMFPMVATLDELRAARQLLAEEQLATGLRAKVGVMIEVPAAAVMAEVFAREVDFFSIGTNDLTQYTLAMDRGHPQLARQADALNPAVLKLIGLTVEGARKHGKWVGVCGGIASDVLAIPALVGLGVDELSVSVPAIPSIKAAVSRCGLSECTALAHELVGLGTAAEVRARLTAFVDRARQDAPVPSPLEQRAR